MSKGNAGEVCRSGTQNRCEQKYEIVILLHWKRWSINMDRSLV